MNYASYAQSIWLCYYLDFLEYFFKVTLLSFFIDIFIITCNLFFLSKANRKIYIILILLTKGID